MDEITQLSIVLAFQNIDFLFLGIFILIILIALYDIKNRRGLLLFPDIFMGVGTFLLVLWVFYSMLNSVMTINRNDCLMYAFILIVLGGALYSTFSTPIISQRTPLEIINTFFISVAVGSFLVWLLTFIPFIELTETQREVILQLAIYSFIIAIILFALRLVFPGIRPGKDIFIHEKISESEYKTILNELKLSFGNMKIIVPRNSIMIEHKNRIGITTVYFYGEQISYLLRFGKYILSGRGKELLLMMSKPVEDLYRDIIIADADIDDFNRLNITKTALEEKLKSFMKETGLLRESTVISMPFLQIYDQPGFSYVKVGPIEIFSGLGEDKIKIGGLGFISSSEENDILIYLMDTLNGLVQISVKDSVIKYKDKQKSVLITKANMVIRTKQKKIVISEDQKLMKFNGVKLIVKKDLVEISKNSKKLIALPEEGRVLVIDASEDKKEEIIDQELAITVREKIDNIIEKAIEEILTPRSEDAEDIIQLIERILYR